MNYNTTKKQREKQRDTLIFLSILIPATMALILSSCSDVYAAPVVSSFTVPQNPLTTSTYIGNTPDRGSFSDVWNFTVENPSEFAGSVTTIKVGGGIDTVAIDAITAILDKATSNITFDYLKDRFTGATMLYLTMPTLDAGNHTITINGISRGGSYGGDINVVKSDQPTATPLPAGLWLFGSGLAGVIGFSKRKK